MYPSIPKDLVEKKLKEILSDKNAPLEISSKLTSPHCITLNSQSRTNAKSSNNEIREKTNLNVGVDVEKELYNRAFKILDFICKLIEYRGHKFELDRNQQTRVIINTVPIHFNIRQVKKNITNDKSAYSSQKYLKTDILAILAYEHSFSTKQWADAKFIKLEDKVIRIVAFLEVYSEVKRQEYLDRAKMNKVCDLEMQIAKDFQQKKDYEKKRLEELMKFSHDLDKAKKIEYYLNERRDFLLSKDLFNEEEKEYYKWGIKKAAWLNPLLNEKDELLDP